MSTNAEQIEAHFAHLRRPDDCDGPRDTRYREVLETNHTGAPWLYVTREDDGVLYLHDAGTGCDELLADALAPYFAGDDWTVADALDALAANWCAAVVGLDNEDGAVTDEQIRELLREARDVGDDAQVGICQLALAGSEADFAECVRVIRAARDE